MDANPPSRKIQDTPPAAPRAADHLALILVVVVYIGLRLWHIRSYSLWGGESYGLALAREGWPYMIHSAVRDVAHPPLFYCLLKLWVAIRGEGILWLKLLPVLFSVATIVPFVLLCRELRLSTRVTSLALFLAAWNGYLIHYSQEVRGYSLLVFLAVTSAWLFVQFFNAESHVLRSAAILTVVNLLLVYTHYHGWVVVAAETLFLLIWGRHRLAVFTMSIAVVVVGFSPWAYRVIREAHGRKLVGSEWVPRPGLSDLTLFYDNLNGRALPGVSWGALAGVLLFVIPVLVWAWKNLSTRSAGQRGDSLVLWWLMFLALLPVGALFLASQLGRQSLFLDRYLVFTALAYYALIAAAVHRLWPGRFRAAYVSLLVAWSVIAGIHDLRTNRMAWEGVQLGSRVDWRSLTQRLVDAEPADDVTVYLLSMNSNGILPGGWALASSMGFFLDDIAHERWRPKVGPRGTIWTGRRGRFLTATSSGVAEILQSSPGRHFWVGYIQSGQAQGSEPQQQLIERGLEVGPAIEQVESENRVVLLPVWARHTDVTLTR